MTEIGKLFGSLRALAHIRPPGRSYADWHRFLEQCREAGVAAILRGQNAGKEEFEAFGTLLGLALLRRWRWLRDAERDGLPFEDAERRFNAAFERDKAALIDATNRQQHDAARAIAERRGTKYGL